MEKEKQRPGASHPASHRLRRKERDIEYRKIKTQRQKVDGII